MLKGNLIVGKNQSVVVRAKSLRDLVRLAGAMSPAGKSPGTNPQSVTSSLKLRVDIGLKESDPVFSGVDKPAESPRQQAPQDNS